MAENIPIDTTEPQPSRHRHETESERTVDIEQTPSALPKLDEPLPDGGYGWVCVACNFFINGKDNHLSHRRFGDQIIWSRSIQTKSRCRSGVKSAKGLRFLIAQSPFLASSR